jgi:hypothetical protein
MPGRLPAALAAAAGQGDRVTACPRRPVGRGRIGRDFARPDEAFAETADLIELVELPLPPTG